MIDKSSVSVHERTTSALQKLLNLAPMPRTFLTSEEVLHQMITLEYGDLVCVNWYWIRNTVCYFPESLHSTSFKPSVQLLEFP
jgi:hypothetical protein